MDRSFPRNFSSQNRKKFEKILGSVILTNPPDVQRFFEPESSLVSPLHDGALFSAWSGDSATLEHVFLKLDPLNHKITLEWRKEAARKSTLTEISTLDLKLVLQGDTPKDLKSVEKSLHSTTELNSENFFTIFSGEWPWDELRLTSEQRLVVQTWVSGIEALIAACRFDSHSKMSVHGSEYWLKCLYIKMFREHGSKLNPTTVVQEFSNTRKWKSRKIVYDILVEDHTLLKCLLRDECRVTFRTFQALYYNYAMQHQEHLKSLYRRYAGKKISLIRNKQAVKVTTTPTLNTAMRQQHRRSSIGASLMGLVERISGSSSSSKMQKKAVTSYVAPQPQASDKLSFEVTVMSLKAFAKFLRVTQEIEEATWEDALKILQKSDPLSELVREDVSEDGPVSLRAFAAYLLGMEGNAIDFNHVGGVHQSMDHTLTDYFISSSHNTYLSGHQLYGESSVNMYIMVLNLGCRCIELDCWDGDNGQPVIYHGMTLVTKINFEDVIKAIAKHAFVASPYPVILSLENHCSIAQQQIMVGVMKNEFGSLLLSKSLDDNSFVIDTLPSPEDLKYKILVKNKKIPSLEDTINRSGYIRRAQSLDELDEPVFTRRNSIRRKNGPRRTSIFTEPVLPLTSLRAYSLDEASERVTTESDWSSPWLPGGLDNSDLLNNLPHSPSPILRNRVRSKVLLCSDGEPPKHTAFWSGTMTEEEETGTVGIGSSSLLSSKRADDLEEPSPSLPRLRRDRTGGSGTQPNSRRMSLFTDGVPGLPLLPNPADDQTGTAGMESSPLLSPTRANDLEEPLPPLPRLRRDRTGGSGSGSGTQPNSRRMSLFTDGVSGLPLLPNPADDQGGTKSSGSLHSLGPSDSTNDMEDPLAKSLPLNGGAKSTKRKLKLKKLRRMSAYIEDHFESRSGRKSTASVESKDSFDFHDGIDSPKDNLERRSASPIGFGYLDTAETACSGKNIAQELSDIVIYLEPLKFISFKNNSWRDMKRTEMFSISEANAKKSIKKTPLDLSEYSVTNLSRIYPTATRITSSNFSPGQFWMHGCQMVALNYQTNDYGMIHNMALFKLNSNCGYILKPKNLHKTCKNYYGNKLEDKTKITITLIAGQNLAPCVNTHVSNGRKASVPSGLPTVEVEVLGVPSESYRFKLVATECQGDIAVWRQSNTVEVSLGFPSFTIIKVSSGSESVALPVSALQSGYRHLYLATGGKMAAAKIPSIFVRIHIEKPDDDEVESSMQCANSCLQPELRKKKITFDTKCPIEYIDTQDECDIQYDQEKRGEENHRDDRESDISDELDGGHVRFDGSGHDRVRLNDSGDGDSRDGDSGDGDSGEGDSGEGDSGDGDSSEGDSGDSGSVWSDSRDDNDECGRSNESDSEDNSMVVCDDDDDSATLDGGDDDSVQLDSGDDGDSVDGEEDESERLEVEDDYRTSEGDDSGGLYHGGNDDGVVLEGYGSTTDGAKLDGAGGRGESLRNIKKEHENISVEAPRGQVKRVGSKLEDGANFESPSVYSINTLQ